MAKSGCRGTIFQFNAKSVLFEFIHEGKESIGTVDPLVISLGADGRRISKRDGDEEAKGLTVDDVARHLQVGDEIICDVTRKEDLPKFVYEEDEEEVTEFGDVINRSNQIEIVPEWLAEEAVLVERQLAARDKQKEKAEQSAKPKDEEKKAMQEEEDFQDEDVIVLEDQLEDMFDYEMEENEEGRDEEDEKKEPSKDKKAEDDEVKEVKAPSPIPASPPSPLASDVEQATAKVLSLKPPVSHKQTGRQKVKVTSGIMEILDGKYKGRYCSTFPWIRLFT